MFLNNKHLVNIITLSGVINSSEGKKFLSLNNVKHLIDKAFSTNKKRTSVAVIINSPGGSPTESEKIGRYLQYKSKKTGIKFITFVDAVAASGGYWLAVSGSEVYSLSDMAIVGSIGVVSSGFGLDKFIEKHSIDRRVYTAGVSKVTMDMFQPEKPDELEKYHKLLKKIHDHFKNWVLLNRGDNLKIEHKDLFTGDVWLAFDAVKYGLIDGVVSSLEEFFEEKYSKKVILKHIKNKKPFLSNLPFSSSFKNVDFNIVEDFFNKIDEKIIKDKFDIK